jgi:hypothetical protein
MNEHDAKALQALIWAVACVLCTLIGSANAYWCIRDFSAVKAGLHQSTAQAGGMWVKDAK